MEHEIQVKFTPRTIPIPADYRPLFKIGHILLILEIACRSNKSSLMKFHFLSWAMKSKRNMEIVLGWVRDDFKNDFHIWGIEPTINRAIIYAVADEFIQEADGDYVLLDKGRDLFKLIKKQKDLFVNEKKFLQSIGKNSITESKIAELANKFF